LLLPSRSYHRFGHQFSFLSLQSVNKVKSRVYSMNLLFYPFWIFVIARAMNMFLHLYPSQFISHVYHYETRFTFPTFDTFRIHLPSPSTRLKPHFHGRKIIIVHSHQRISTQNPSFLSHTQAYSSEGSCLRGTLSLEPHLFILSWFFESPRPFWYSLFHFFVVCDVYLVS